MPTPQLRSAAELAAAGMTPLTVDLFPNTAELRAYPPGPLIVSLADEFDRHCLGERTLAVGATLSCAIDCLATGDPANALRFLAAATLTLRRIDATRAENGGWL